MVLLRKCGVDMLLFGNEGNEEIRADITVSGLKEPLFLDLWRGKCYRVEGAAGTFTLSLQPSETILVTEGEGVDTVECRKPDRHPAEYPDWTDRFSLLEKGDNTAVYGMDYLAEEVTEPLRFSVRAEEMVECWCNGSFVDVSFWGRHRFALETLRKGTNEIRLVVTGNAANIYENAGIAFGLEGNGG